jgi:hypothetical protein
MGAGNMAALDACEKIGRVGSVRPDFADAGTDPLAGILLSAQASPEP